MGNVWQKIVSKYHNKEVRILMVGLDAAGKTTMLYKMKLGEVVTTIPTIGFTVDTVTYKNVNFVSWDLGGRCPIRPLWRHYYQNTDVLLFVVDSNDRDRISECKDELWRFLGEDQLKDTIVLIMANKQDLPNAMSVAEVSEKLEVDKVRDRKIYVQGSCACRGEGLFEGLSWIEETLTQQALKKSVSKPMKEVLAVPEEKKSHSWWSTISNYFIQAPTVS